MRINPKNFYDRELEILPPYFVNTVVRAHEAEVEVMRKWIYENCTGRYCVVKDVKWDKDAWKGMTTIGFEHPSDMTLFALSGLMTDKPKY